MPFPICTGRAERAAELVRASRAADLVIGAGDFCTMRQGLPEALALLGGLAAPMIAVPGNAESVEELRDAAGAGVTVLHGQTAVTPAVCASSGWATGCR